MSSVLLTDIFISRLKPKDKLFEVFNKNAKGLTIRVSPGGGKSCGHFYRFKGGSIAAKPSVPILPCLSKKLDNEPERHCVKFRMGSTPKQKSSGRETTTPPASFPVLCLSSSRTPDETREVGAKRTAFSKLYSFPSGVAFSFSKFQSWRSMPCWMMSFETVGRARAIALSQPFDDFSTGALKEGTSNTPPASA